MGMHKVGFTLFVLLFVSCFHPHIRLSASCRQGAELDWEEVQGTESHQYLRSPPAFAGTAFSSNDFLGEHAPGGPGLLVSLSP